jgi:hypothetical protein
LCAARAAHNMSSVSNYDPDADFTLMAPTLSDDRIAELLPNLDEFIRWAKDLKEWALREQVFGRKKFAGLKLVAGRSNRKVVNEDALVDTLKANGVEEALLFTRKLVGITELEKVVGKKKFAELTAGYTDPLTGTTIEALVKKPPGKPKLVLADDKRPEWVPEDAAEIDFGGIDDKE